MASQETVQAAGADNVDLSALTKVKDPTVPTNVKNAVDGSYLWIVTPEPISVAAEANSTITGGIDNIYTFDKSANFYKQLICTITLVPNTN